MLPRRPSLSSALVLLAATLVAGAGGRAAAQGSGLERTVDPAVRPGQDFFGYANGAWLAATTVPAGRERWGARDEIAALTCDRLAAVLADAAHAPPGSTARKIADFRAAYLDEGAIEARGLSGIAPLLAEIQGLTDRAALTRYLGRTMLADADPMNWGIYRSATPLGFAVEEGLNGERTNVPLLVQGGLGLPDREDNLGTAPEKVELRARYRAYVERILTLAGVEYADAHAARVLDLETAVARTHATAAASAQDHNADSLWTRADFARRAPGMDWSAFFAAAGMPRQRSFIAWQPGALAGMAALVGAHPLEGWKDYLTFRLLDRYADLLPREFAEASAEMHGTAGTPREARALTATQAALG
ncbi:MAG TPA: M13 family metallopeptidase N-terminal domain-containing protein, partial [Gemmatimonadales bacterium]|nr:M13 family metallopeptidase N-terminal domain-containing protein [Gemmatimonadales bacterium]